MHMSAAENKRLIQDIFSELSKGNGKPFVESLADDFCWTITGTTTWSGTYRGRQAVLTELLGPLFSRFADRYTNTADRFIAEGDYVVVECRGRVTTKEGRPYNNTYCWVCRISGGKLRELTEYMDTELVTAALGPRQPLKSNLPADSSKGEGKASKLKAGLDGVTFISEGRRLLGGFYRAAGDTPRPTAILLHGLPGIEKHLDIAYRLRDLGWNCFCFHFRGCWGSEGAFSLAGLADDTRAAMEWIIEQPSVDRDRIALIGASTGSHPALVCGATDRRIRAIVGVSPLIEPRAFQFPEEMADEFARMLSGVTGQDLREQWQALPPLADSLRAFAPRPLLLVAAGKDDIFPLLHYADSIAGLGGIQLICDEESDHGFSTSRPWLVRTVTDWLVAKLGA
jgi:ketosteroid isomerase-like protein/pimeloyl-ACP methyl ester carboxylesterase